MTERLPNILVLLFSGGVWGCIGTKAEVGGLPVYVAMKDGQLK